jgi:hypothetical protein
MNKRQIEFLEDCAQLEGSELGEGIDLLLQMKKYSYVYSDNFLRALNKEIKEMYDHMMTNFEIVEEDHITTTKIRILVER